MAIGVFDSGVGGLTVHHRLVERFPDRRLHLPGRPGQHALRRAARRGDRRPDPRRLRAAVRRGLRPGGPGLQHRRRRSRCAGCSRPGCPATGASSAGRSTCWASSCRPSRRPPACPGSTRPSGAATRSRSSTSWASSRRPATAASRVYEIEIDKRRQDVAVFSEPCPELARDDRGRRAARRSWPPAIEGHVAGAHHAASAARRTGRSSAAPTTRSSPTCSAPPCRPARR